MVDRGRDDPYDAVALLLQWGTWSGLGLFAAGMAATVVPVWFGAPMPSPTAFGPDGAIRWNVALLLAGLLSQIATPVLRVILVMVAYGRSGRLRMSALAATTLAAIAIAVVLSLTGLIAGRR